MATTSLDSSATEGLAGARCILRATSVDSQLGGSLTVYCYRTTLAAQGTSTDPDAIPPGAEIERVTR